MAQATKTVLAYRDRLQRWKKEHAPQSMEEEWYPLFCEALRQEAWIEYFLDELLFCSKEQFKEIKECCSEEVLKIGKRLEQSVGGNDGRNRESQLNDGSDRQRPDKADEEELRAGVSGGSDFEGCVSIE